MKNKLYLFVVVLVCVSLLSACAAPTAAPVVQEPTVEEVLPVATEVPEATEAPATRVVVDSRGV